MKLLLLIRHAKSSWKDTRLDDHDRTLNKRGEHDAPFMATVLKKKHITTDLIISSTAIRALLTAKIFAKELGYKKDHIIQDKGLYLAELEELIEIVKQLPDKNSVVCLFGHNPGITSFTNFLCNAGIDNVPTCGICAISFPFDSWQEVASGNGKLDFFEFPKLYFKDAED